MANPDTKLPQATDDMQALAEAFAVFTETTQTMEESYRRLEKRVEALDAELAQKNRELAFTNDYLQYILESMSDGVIAVDTTGSVTAFNRAAGEVLGYVADEVIGRPFRDLFGREFSAPPGRQAMELQARDARKIPVGERDEPISDRDRNRIGSVKVFQDLSEIEELRAQVRQKDRLAAVGEMAATVAHEIRNPLGGMRGFAALLARDLEPEHPGSRLVEKILAGARDLEQVVSELLEYTRPVQLRLRSTSCREAVEAAVGYIPLAENNIRVDNTIGGTVRVSADPDKLRQVLLNVLLNATQSVTGDGAVTIAAENAEAFVVLSVSDTGCGMTAEQSEKIFSPFFTTKEKGTGLGLAVAQKLIEAHGGSIEVNSQVDVGSTFRIRLPRAE
jgi:PAS domain S-box-containing protein